MSKKHVKQLLALLLLLLPLAGCGSDGEKFGPLPSDIAPFFGGGGGSAPAAPAQAPAQAPNVPGTAGVMAIQREQYGAVNAAGCDAIARRMAKRGFRLVEVVPNNLGTGGVLDVICVFESDSADPGDGRIYAPQY
ncbi:hypothetical protein [Stenomitos frigidus]|uniref:DUF4359 domain-containing protein n=1 Tax=Stenomitos frigidus ULC18 TaxID=2107698 RepID=A0A2T1EB02_9CYAN|nr:hypothetical protein [Stenomitos frigidus]PSB29888.1 hypothetical protein C7B82_10065 [Stenomitos frigidus ULC18]